MDIKTILKHDGVGILPTDTLYGLVGSALSKKAVARIYRLRKRDKNKPLIILISSIGDLRMFGVQISPKIQLLLRKLWPNKVSVILPCVLKKFRYLHRGTKTLAFRLPKKKNLITLLKKTRPLVAPSANPQGLTPALTIAQAKKYFGNHVDFYVNAGTLRSEPSTLIAIEKGNLIIKRFGAVKILVK